MVCKLTTKLYIMHDAGTTGLRTASGGCRKKADLDNVDLEDN